MEPAGRARVSSVGSPRSSPLTWPASMTSQRSWKPRSFIPRGAFSFCGGHTVDVLTSPTKPAGVTRPGRDKVIDKNTL
jgi:hypothetical protein